jgi:hypothetical protein
VPLTGGPGGWGGWGRARPRAWGGAAARWWAAWWAGEEREVQVGPFLFFFPIF